MFYVSLAGDHLYWKRVFNWLSLLMSFILSYFCCHFFHEMSWMRSGTELSQFLRVFLPTLVIHKPMFVDLAGDHLYGKLLFTWLSLVMSMIVSFCAVPFPTRCLG